MTDGEKETIPLHTEGSRFRVSVGQRDRTAQLELPFASEQAARIAIESDTE